MHSLASECSHTCLHPSVHAHACTGVRVFMTTHAFIHPHLSLTMPRLSISELPTTPPFVRPRRQGNSCLCPNCDSSRPALSHRGAVQPVLLAAHAPECETTRGRRGESMEEDERMAEKRGGRRGAPHTRPVRHAGRRRRADLKQGG
eukprot:3937199-Rhodomonas_salina.1